MARKFDSSLLVVSVVATFFATFFAALLLFRWADRESPDASVAGDPSAAAPAPVSAEPPDGDSESSAKSRLEQLGVKCAEGADC